MTAIITGDMLQWAAVIAILAIVAVIILRKTLRINKQLKGNCPPNSNCECCGCSGCPVKSLDNDKRKPTGISDAAEK